MTRFRQDNTDGYAPADLAEMNTAFDRIMIEDYSGIPEDMRKSIEDKLAEDIQFAFDRGARGACLLLV